MATDEQAKTGLLIQLNEKLEQLKYRFSDDPRNSGRKVEDTFDYKLTLGCIQYIEQH